MDLLKKVDQAAAAAGRTIEVLVQVDLALEATKHGAPVDARAGDFRRRGRLRVGPGPGLMLLPPLAENPEDARPWFARLRGVRDRLA